MKHIIFLILLVFSSCDRIPRDGDTVDNPPTIIIEGCEYIQVRANYDKAYTHKGNCKNQIHKCQ